VEVEVENRGEGEKGLDPVEAEWRRESHKSLLHHQSSSYPPSSNYAFE
jgi:hypothetical protein